MTDTQFSVSFIGKYARRLLVEATTASILGVTSKGIFLKIGGHGIVFLSNGDKRGPLTLNLDRSIPPEIALERNQAVILSHGDIYFSRSKIQVETHNAIDWLIPPRPTPLLIPGERNRRIRSVAGEIISQRGHLGMTHLLAGFLSIPLPDQSDGKSIRTPFDVQRLEEGFHQENEDLIISALKSTLGVGTGLTPSGDDLIMGFLLAKNRYPDFLWPSLDFHRINQSIVQLAYQKTSLLSANLVECATRGEGDERLIQAFDGILAGTLDPARCAQYLFDWGNSSGCDAFTGMALAAYQKIE